MEINKVQSIKVYLMPWFNETLFGRAPLAPPSLLPYQSRKWLAVQYRKPKAVASNQRTNLQRQYTEWGPVHNLPSGLCGNTAITLGPWRGSRMESGSMSVIATDQRASALGWQPSA
ncbi:uncharacterized protein [Zea mays]|uniref:uncharacterized protein n=1 Tax=Zea mays TaxID=4577 RepID=UPI0004DEB456|nr:uncharacterized protein LOC103651192 [Zea mays]|eukprot:XP_008675033.1 uncharacterized protein LOC103651192 [Zea mays]